MRRSPISTSKMFIDFLKIPCIFKSIRQKFNSHQIVCYNLISTKIFAQY